MYHSSFTYDEAERLMRTGSDLGYGKRRKLGNNTYLYPANGAYEVVLHTTAVVIVHPDGTFTLNSGSWRTLTSKNRINCFSPARVYAENSEWYVSHNATDPKTPVKLIRCRVCKGNGRSLHDRACYACTGSGQRDYGSKPDPYVFHDGIRVDSTGKVIPAVDDYRKYEGADERAARLQRAHEQATRNRVMRACADRQQWLAAYGYDPDAATIIVYKGVRHDLMSQHGFYYPLGTTVTAPDWQPRPSCGNGLHFSATPVLADLYASDPNGHARYLACEIRTQDMIVLQDKVKAPSARVLHEVTRDMIPVRQESEGEASAP